jgi:ABC-type multidrug transport system fused ATPase/permease subunit
MFNVEKLIGMATTILAAPFVNLFAFAIIVRYQGWLSMAIVLAAWAAQLLLQYLSSRTQKKYQAAQSDWNDKAITLANDLIVGCRTIKCYGWENYYIEGIRDARNHQYSNVYWINVVFSLGPSIFRNFGLIAIMIIVLIEWSRGNKLEMNNIVAILATVFVLFNSINFYLYLGFTILYQFSAIIDRIASILNMEENE